MHRNGKGNLGGEVSFCIDELASVCLGAEKDVFVFINSFMISFRIRVDVWFYCVSCALLPFA